MIIKLCFISESIVWDDSLHDNQGNKIHVKYKFWLEPSRCHIYLVSMYGSSQTLFYSAKKEKEKKKKKKGDSLL